MMGKEIKHTTDHKDIIVLIASGACLKSIHINYMTMVKEETRHIDMEPSRLFVIANHIADSNCSASMGTFRNNFIATRMKMTKN